MLYTATHSTRHVAERQQQPPDTNCPCPLDPPAATSAYENLLHSIDGIVWEADPETLRFTLVSAQAERILGYPVRQWLEEPEFWVNLVLALEPDLGRVKVDPGQFEQVVMNLVVNARDAMPQGGTLTLETRNISASPGDHPELRPGDYVLLTVRDTGCGMDAETLAHIFEPFFSTKGERGTGLGLAMVHGVVNQSGGHIGVDSLPGAGTTFRIYLPRVDDVPVSAPPAPEEPPRQRARETTVLLVEDEDAVRRLARLTLESHGFTVLEARSPGDALLLAEQHPGAIHLLVTDVIMPGMNGLELADRLLRSRPGLKVLYMSGYSDEILDERGGLGPGLAFLPKPYSPTTLARKVFEILQR